MPRKAFQYQACNLNLKMPQNHPILHSLENPIQHQATSKMSQTYLDLLNVKHLSKCLSVGSMPYEQLSSQ